MKTDFYTKTVLTIIAVCLSIIVVKDLQLIPTAQANESLPIFNTNYGLVPLNEDGSVNVHLKSSETINVNIEEVGGRYTRGKVPVVIKENEDK